MSRFRLNDINYDLDAAVVPEEDVDATKFVATALIVRGLRAAGLHHVLAGAPCIIAIVGVTPSMSEVVADAVRDLLKRTARPRSNFSTIVHDHTGPKVRKTLTVDGLTETLQMGTRFCCLFANTKAIPSALLYVADGIAVMPEVDAGILTAASLKTVGKIPAPADLRSLATLPLPLLAVALKAGRSSAQGAALARRLTAARLADGDQNEGRAPAMDATSANKPKIEDLHGLGEAAEWGRSLAMDLDDYRAGRIGWGDVDRGALVSGPPGTGKTTFALAVGRTCDVPVFVHSFARWQATGYLNDMLKAMRAAFSEAQAAAPCILFVDEVDSVGDRARFSDKNASYAVQVVNAFLECLDGADARTGVVVIGATNHPEMIDPAVRRAGRLDRDIRVALPDLPARIGILRHHLRDALNDVDLSALASRLEGASGADIEQTVRDARRLARRARRELLTADIEATLPSCTVMSDELFWRTCVHEAGHVVVGLALAARTGSVPLAAKVVKQFGSGSEGVTEFRRDNGFDRTRDAYLAEIAVLLAGGAAEEVVLGSKGAGSGGADGCDLQLATKLAVLVEASFGLGESLVHSVVPDDRDLARLVALNSELATKVHKILSYAYSEAKKTCSGENKYLEAVACHLSTHGQFQPADQGDSREVPDRPFLSVRSKHSTPHGARSFQNPKRILSPHSAAPAARKEHRSDADSIVEPGADTIPAVIFRDIESYASQKSNPTDYNDHG